MVYDTVQVTKYTTNLNVYHIIYIYNGSKKITVGEIQFEKY